MIRPMMFEWNGEVMTPHSADFASQYYNVGERYRLTVFEERSRKSHNHFFACVVTGFNNLPEQMADLWPTSEHLRKWCLIKSGYNDERSVVCSSKAEAQRVAAFVKPMDDFAIVSATESVVTIYTAKSQSERAMGKKTFQESKTAVLDMISEMIGVTVTTLETEAREQAA